MIEYAYVAYRGVKLTAKDNVHEVATVYEPSAMEEFSILDLLLIV